MLTRENYQTVIEDCVARFSQCHPDCGFDADTFSFQVAEPGAFIDAIMSVQVDCEYKMLRDECVRNHADNDAILIRGKTKRAIIVKYLPEKPPAALYIAVYHELAHEYAMRREIESGHVFSTSGEEKSGASEPAPANLSDAAAPASDRTSRQSSPDMLPGYLLWKEFIADYLAYDALHRDLARFPATGKTAVDAMAQLIPAMCAGTMSLTLNAFSAMANACAIIMNFGGFHEALYNGTLKMPINRRKRAGRELYDMVMDLLFMLADRLELDDPYAVTDAFLSKLGYAAVEARLLHEDYDDEVGWA